MTQATPLTAEQHAKAQANWRLMPADMREFATALVAAGLADGRPANAEDGRRMLAGAQVAVFPDRLPAGDGVQPCIATAAEREAIEAIRNRGARR